MLRVRLQRRGKKNYATYRVVIAEQHAPIKGRFIADVGSYNPHTSKLAVDATAVTDWISKGAQPTPTVHNLLIENGVIKGDKVTSWRPKQKEATAGESDGNQASATPPADTANEAAPADTSPNEETPAEPKKNDEKTA